MSQSRRQFVKVSLGAGGSLCLSFSLPQKLMGFGKSLDKRKTTYRSLYLEVTGDNDFIFTFDKAEMGQGVFTGQATMFGEEADIAPTSMKLQPALANPAYGTRGGTMVTGGSTSTPDRFEVLRQAGAVYREHVLRAAAKTWGVPQAELSTSDGQVFHSHTSKSARYSEFNLIMAKSDLPEIKEVSLKKKSEWKYIGKFSDSLDAREKSVGAPEFGLDFEIPGMKTAVVLRSPVFGGALEYYDEKSLKALPGVVDVKRIYSGVAIICQKYWQCLDVLKKVKSEWIRWRVDEKDKISTESLYADYLESLDQEPPAPAAGQKVVSSEYYLPYLAHAPMEPQNGLAWKQKDKFEFWIPTQAPTFVQNHAALKSGLKREQIIVHNAKYLGGGFGRRAQLDYPMELTEISLQVDYPVKLMWSREDDTNFSPMRPMSVHKLDAVIGQKVESWRHQIAGQSFLQNMLKESLPIMMPEWMPEGVSRGLGKVAEGSMDLFGMAPMLSEGAKQDYELPFEVETVEKENSVPVTFWRSVGSSHNGFVVESFLDEVFTALSKDPLDGRLELLRNSPRARKVVEVVAEKSGYRNYKSEKNRALGLAYHYSFKTHVAEVAEVEIQGSKIIVHKVYAAVDLGTAINPDIVVKQVQSGIIFGLSAALSGKIEFKDGRMQQSNFHDYPLLRINETPDIEVAIVDSDEKPSGIGEPGLPPIAAAVGNAIFKITGKRLRKLPLDLG